MQLLDSSGDDDSGTVFRDIIMLALLGFVTFVIMLLPHLNPPTKDTATVQPPGNVVVEVHWPNKLDSDVDLWVEAPGDKPVGYSNKGGRIFNLLRDDLGRTGDTTELNYEVAYSRGVPAGDYTVNLHLYRNRGGTLPVAADVVVSVKNDESKQLRQVAKKRVSLARVGQEMTVMRFSLDKNGNVVPGSIHTIPRPLRVGRRGE